jgi:hypothetical protein
MTADDPFGPSPFGDPDADGPTERVIPVDPEKTVVITPTSGPAAPGSDDVTVTVTPPQRDDDEATVVVSPPTPAVAPPPAAAPAPPIETPAAPAQLQPPPAPIAGGYAPAQSYGTPPPQPAAPVPGSYAPAATYGAPPAVATPASATPAPAGPVPAADRKGRAHWLIPVAVAGGVAVLAVLIVLIVQPRPVQAPFADRLNITAAQPAIRAVLADPAAGYGLPDVTDVTCNHGSDPHIISGTTFDCDITVAGHPLQATMTFLNDDGAYSVGRPQ